MQQRLAPALLALFLAHAACEPDAASRRAPHAPRAALASAQAEPEPDTSEVVDPEPINLSAVDRGVGLHHGGALAAAGGGADSFKEIVEGAPHAMLHVSAYDTMASSFGTYSYFVLGEVGTSVAAFKADPRLARASARAQDLRDELDEALALAGAPAPASVSVTLDLWRPNKSWFVRWDGDLGPEQNRTGTTYGFGDEQLVENLLGEVEAIASAQQPRYFILGREMERLWNFSQGPDLAKSEWRGFIAFVHEASSRIKAVSPQTEIGVGIEWDRFATEIAPAYLELAGIDELPQGLSAQAYAARGMLAPVWELSDIIAISSYANPDEDRSEAYRVLADVPSFTGLVERPVVIYAAGSPITTPGAESAQALYAQGLSEQLAGVPLEAIYWRRLIDIDGAQGGNQQIGGRCRELVENQERGYLLERSSCFDGLLSTLFRPKGAASIWAGAP